MRVGFVLRTLRSPGVLRVAATTACCCRGGKSVRSSPLVDDGAVHLRTPIFAPVHSASRRHENVAGASQIRVTKLVPRSRPASLTNTFPAPWPVALQGRARLNASLTTACIAASRAVASSRDRVRIHPDLELGTSCAGRSYRVPHCPQREREATSDA